MSYIAALLASNDLDHADESGGIGAKTDESRLFVSFGGSIPGASLIPALPPEWRAGLASLQLGGPPIGMSGARWRELVGDAAKLGRKWGALAHSLGWDALNLFGYDPNPAARRLDTAGLAALLGGRRVVALDGVGATILDPSGDRLRFRRNLCPGASCPAAGSVPLWRIPRPTFNAGERA